MAFNSADTAAFKNVWVFCEQRQGKMMPTTFELISEGRKLADELGVELCGILRGDDRCPGFGFQRLPRNLRDLAAAVFG